MIIFFKISIFLGLQFKNSSKNRGDNKKVKEFRNRPVSLVFHVSLLSLLKFLPLLGAI